MEAEGYDAYGALKGECDCPFVDRFGEAPSYWESEVGKRQRWLNGFWRAWQETLRRRHWQRGVR